MMHSENIKFYLHSPKSDKPTAIYAKVHLNGEEVKVSIDHKIHPELWDRVSQRPTTDKVTINEWRKHEPTIRVVLDNIGSRINRVASEIVSFVNLTEQSGQEVSKQMLRRQVNIELGLENRQTPNQSIIAYTNQFILDIESGKRLTSKKNRYSEGTIKNYKGFLTQLTAFQKSTKKTIQFNDVTLKMYDEYVEFFQKKDYTPNTIGRHIKQFKVIMRSAEEDGIHSNKIYTNKKFILLSAPVESIYLTDEEIDKMYKLDLSDKPMYELVRDAFVLGSQIAQRFSDYIRIRPHHIQEAGHDLKLIMRAHKTDQKINVPLNSIAIKILQKYNQSIPKVPEQVFNRYIKLIGKWAGINQPIEYIKHLGSEKIKVIEPKYELITSHTARRSGATNMLKSKLTLDEVRRITGHKTIKNLLTYIRLTEDEVYERIKESPFFKK